MYISSHSTELCVEAATAALRKVFFPKFSDEFKTVAGEEGVDIYSPYSEDIVACVDCNGLLGNDIYLTPQAPYENGDEIDAFEDAVIAEIRDWEDRFIAN